MRDRIFYAICFGFVFGVLVRSLAPIDFYAAILLALVSLALISIFSLITRNKWMVIISVFILALSLGILRFHLADKPAPGIFESRAGQKVALSGEIVDEPDTGENNQKLTIEVREGGVKTKILTGVNFGEDFKYGDEVNFSGKLEKPENFTTDQGKVFDYVNYLRKDGIYYVMNYARADIVSRGHGSFIKSALFSVKEKFLDKMNFAIASPENLLMGGLILGEKSAFSQELRTQFINTGTIHIVALSGYNVTIVAEWIMKLFSHLSFMPKNFGIGLGILAIILFVIMTGASSTAIRAGIMATLALVARLTGRNYDAARALIVAGVFMVLLNPLLLVYDVSFQLSFIATVAVIFFTPKIEKYFLWAPERFQLRDILSVTAAAYIFVFPFILYKMGNLSLVALPANALILPFIPLTMLLGFITGFVGLLWYGLAVPAGYLSYLLLHYELGVIGFFSSMPFAAFAIPDFPLAATLLIYAYFVYILFGRSIKSFFSETL